MAIIEQMFLQRENSSRLGETTVGTAVKASGHDHLWGERESAIDTIILHYMSDRFRSPDDPYNREKLLSIFCEYGVSAHYLVLRDGNVLHLVPEENKAWHAGGSIMPAPDNRTGVNDFSIGIELAGSELEPFTELQYNALSFLLFQLHGRYHIENVLGHEHISGERAVEQGLRKDEKIDPGPQFDWRRIHYI